MIRLSRNQNFLVADVITDSQIRGKERLLAR
jgi:hypothetical protein